MTTSEKFFWTLVGLSLVYEITYSLTPGIIQIWARDLRKTCNVPIPEGLKEVEGEMENTNNWMLAVLSTIAIVTAFTGLFSSQSFFFGLYIVFSMLVHKLYKKFNYAKWIIAADGAICTTLLSMAISNKFFYHFKFIDVWHLIMTKL